MAGSGKTSAILHRIAYLLYHSRAVLNADQIVLFSHNNLFSHYISEVLPSLGERNMRQVTLEGFVRRRFAGLKVESLFDRYETRQAHPDADRTIANFMDGTAAMGQARRHAGQLPDSDLQFTDLRFNGRVFFSPDHIRHLYQALPAAMAPADRLVHLKNKLIRELQHRVRTEAKSDWVAKELDDLDVQQLHRLYGKKTVDDFADEDAQYAYLSRRWAKRRLRIIADAIYNNYFLDFYNQYERFLRQVKVPATISNRDWTNMILNYQDEVEFHRLELMHAAPLMYLRDLITGGGQNRAFQYVFIDEMQDYSLAMMVYLRHAFPQARFTVLGDSEQALFKPLQLPETMLKELSGVLEAKHPNLIALRRSYRSTKEITDFAKALLPDGDQIISFTRHGAKPRLLVRYSAASARQALVDEVNKLHQDNETVAILTKNRQQAQDVYQILHRQKLADLHLLSEEDSALPTGILVLPIYLAKGLEFDAVLAYDVSAANLSNTDAVGMVYTMASRAMHQLTLLSIGAVSPVLTTKACQKLVIEHEIVE